MSAEALLAVEGLSVALHTGSNRIVRPVDDVSFEIARGEVLGLVGESGCGKSMTSLALLGLLPQPEGRIESGAIRFDGEDLARPDVDWQTIRGRRIAMIFQEPMTSLNPYLKLEEQLIEAPMRHFGLSRSVARDRAIAMLGRVGVSDAATRIRGYAHQLSGGLRQRVMIATALLCEPDLLIADEATTALDVSIQAQILNLLGELRRERGLAILFVSHDLGVIGSLCDRVLVMYAGQIVEEAPSAALFGTPSHPYTRALLACTPGLSRTPGGGTLSTIEGLPPRLDGPFTACRYAERCSHVIDLCRETLPGIEPSALGGSRRCLRPLAELDR